jgi:hypothetical protein
MTDRPSGNRPGPDNEPDSRAEQVLSQALRVMAGGGRAAAPNAEGTQTSRRLSTTQLILLAAIVGLMIGIAAGFVSLMF